MVLPTNFWLLFLAALVISSIGFKNYVWFISLGYGFSIAGEGLLLMLLFGSRLTEECSKKSKSSSFCRYRTLQNCSLPELFG